MPLFSCNSRSAGGKIISKEAAALSLLKIIVYSLLFSITYNETQKLLIWTVNTVNSFTKDPPTGIAKNPAFFHDSNKMMHFRKVPRSFFLAENSSSPSPSLLYRPGFDTQTRTGGSVLTRYRS